MKKLTFKFLPSKKNIIDGIAPITLRITLDRKSTYLSLGKTYSINIKDWDYHKDLPKRNNNNDLLINNLKKMEMIVNNELLTITNKINEFSLPDIKNSLKIKLNNSDNEVELILYSNNDQIDFLSYFKEQNERKKTMGKYGTYDNYQKIYANIFKYLKGSKVPISYINVKFLENYEVYLKDVLKNKTNSRQNNFKTIRAVINRAISEDLLPQEKYPFKKFKLKSEKPKRDCLTLEELRQLENLDIKPNFMKFHHLNMFLFATYTGLRISDILTLKWESIVDDKLYFRMRKTESPISIKLIEKAKGILKFYSNSENIQESYVFTPLKKSTRNLKDTIIMGKCISSSTAYINKNMFEISKQLGFHKRLNFHTSRHSYATLLLKSSVPIQAVKELLGHSKIQTTMIYVHMTNEVLDSEMDKFNIAMNNTPQ